MEIVQHQQHSLNALATSACIIFQPTGVVLHTDATQNDVVNFINRCSRASVYLRLCAGDALIAAATRFGGEPLEYVGGDGSSYDYWQETVMIARFFGHAHRYDGVQHFSHYRRGIYEAHRDKSRGCLLSPEDSRRILAQCAARGDSADVVKALARQLLYGEETQDATPAAKNTQPPEPETKPSKEEAPEISDGEGDGSQYTPEVHPPAVRGVVSDFCQSASKLAAMVTRDAFTEDERTQIRKTMDLLKRAIG